MGRVEEEGKPRGRGVVGDLICPPRAPPHTPQAAASATLQLGGLLLPAVPPQRLAHGGSVSGVPSDSFQGPGGEHVRVAGLCPPPRPQPLLPVSGVCPPFPLNPPSHLACGQDRAATEVLCDIGCDLRETPVFMALLTCQGTFWARSWVG